MAKPTYRLFGRVFLVVICLLLLAVFLQPVLRLVGAQSTVLTRHAPYPAELDPITLHLTLNETGEEDLFTVALDKIRVTYTSTSEQWSRGDQICIRSLFLGTRPFISAREYELSGVCTNDPAPNLFFDLYVPGPTTEELQDTVYGMLVEERATSIGQSDFFFPFDRREISFAVSLKKEDVVFYDKGMTRRTVTEIAPQTHITLSSQKWEAFVETIYDLTPYRGRSDLSNNDEQIDSQLLNDSDTLIGDELISAVLHLPIEIAPAVPTTMVYMTLQRPLAQRLLTPVLLGGILVFIFLLIFINDHGACLEVAVGILLGLWGVQNILIPSYISGPTFIEVIILTLYVLLIFAIFIRFVIKPFWNRLGSSDLLDNGTEPQLPSRQEAEESYTLSPSLPVLLDSPQSKNRTVWHNIVIIILVVILTFIGLIQYIRNKMWPLADN